MISPEIIEEIRQRADIVDVISTYINVIKKGNSFVAVCPFHNDSNPSLQISRTKQIYHCFACGAGGNVFTFVQEYEKIPFIEAVRKVASLIGYANKELEKPTRTISNEAKVALEALKEASELYSYTLKTKEGEDCLNYLEKRHIDQEMIDFFNLGFSPKDGELSIKMLRSKNISIEALDKAGIITRSNSSFIDRFKGRLIFPLNNEFGEVVGFSARRILDNEEAKYVNSLNTVVFNKSKVLYNYQNAIKCAKKEGYVYITEGFMDVFSLYKANIKSCVAIMGTAFTESHAKMIKKLGVEARLCLDGDDAGQGGILKMIDILDQAKVPYKIVNYGKSKQDPDDILQEYGVEVLKKLLNRLIDKEEFILNYYKKIYDLNSLTGKKDFSNSVLEFVKKEKDIVEQELFLKKLSEITSISFETYRRMLDSFAPREESEVELQPSQRLNFVKPKHKFQSKYEKVSNVIIHNLLTYQEAIECYSAGNNYFNNDLYDKIANYILDCAQVNPKVDPSSFIDFINQVGDEQGQDLINKVTQISSEEKDNDHFDEKQFAEYINILQEEIEKKKIKDTLSNPYTNKDVKAQSEMLEKYFKKN